MTAVGASDYEYCWGSAGEDFRDGAVVPFE